MKVNQFDLSDYNLPTKIYWSILLLVSVAVFGFGIFGSFSFSLPQILTLAGAILISSISNQHQLKIPKFKTYFSAKELIVFAGVMWLGVTGGILLSVASEIAGYRIASKDKKRWAVSVFSGIIATFIAGQVFYLFLNNVGGLAGNVVANNEIGIQWLVAGIAIMIIVHYAVHLLLCSVFLTLEGEYPFIAAIKDNVVLLSASYLLGLIGVFAVYFAFLNFGVAIGLVVLPTVIVANLSYRIHFQSLAVKTKEISESSRIHLATVDALATAIDARDQVGIGHVRRTQIYAVGIGELLGLNSDEIQALRTGSLLHDIGKLGVPDHILNKPGRLTSAEMEKMKIHSTVGASILEKVKFPYPVVSTVKYHHEMWDGTGYPEGLKKEEIPLTARILSVADAYDTLRGARPYRAAVSRDEARRFILNGSGLSLTRNWWIFFYET